MMISDRLRSTETRPGLLKAWIYAVSSGSSQPISTLEQATVNPPKEKQGYSPNNQNDRR
jgi:hypothetical protein